MVEKVLLYVQNYKYWHTQIPYWSYLKREIEYNIRNGNKPFFNWRTETLKNSFFSYTIETWSGSDLIIINSKLSEFFKWKLLAFIRPVQR